jgi:hypothetical protein
MIYNDGEDIYDDSAEDYNTEGPVYSSLAKCGGSCSWIWSGNSCDVGNPAYGSWVAVSLDCASGCSCAAGESGCSN